MTNEEAMERITYQICLRCKYALYTDKCKKCHYQKALDALKKSDKYRWHDLRKNPEDLPAEHKQYLMEYKYSDKETVYGTPIFIAEEKRWSDETSAPKLRWREIEPFEGEEDEK